MGRWRALRRLDGLAGHRSEEVAEHEVTTITDAEGRKICAERYKVSADVRAARKRAGGAQKMKRAGRGSK